MLRCATCTATYPSDVGFCPMDGTALVPAATTFDGEPADSGAAHDARVGQVLDERYRIDERIGAGGMGVVYRATHVTIGKVVAIKILRGDASRKPDIVRRFLLEAQLASRLHHPNVVEITDFGEAPGGSAYYVMEFLQGHSLATEIDKNGAMEPTRAIHVATEIATGLAAAAREGIVHRDLKPDNVFLTRRAPNDPERVKILDFGIARVTGQWKRLTATGAVVGTPEYMSPEQAQGQEVDVRTDLYSLGMLLFEMLTAEVAFRGPTVASTLTKQLFEAMPRLLDRRPQLAQLVRTDAVIQRLTAKSRDERPANADDVVRLLQQAAKEDLVMRVSGARPTVPLGSWALGQEESDDVQRPALPRGSAPDWPRAASWAAVDGAAGSGAAATRDHVAHHAPGVGMAYPLGGRSGSGLLVTLALALAILASFALLVGLLVLFSPRTAETSGVAPTELPRAARTVTVRFESEPSGAEVVDETGATLGSTPLSHAMDRSDAVRRFRLKMKGWTDVEREVLPTEDQTVTVVLLSAAPVATAAPAAVQAPRSGIGAKARVGDHRPSSPVLGRTSGRPRTGHARPSAPSTTPRPKPDPHAVPAEPASSTKKAFDLKDPFGPE